MATPTGRNGQVGTALQPAAQRTGERPLKMKKKWTSDKHFPHVLFCCGTEKLTKKHWSQKRLCIFAPVHMMIKQHIRAEGSVHTSVFGWQVR